MLYAAAVGIGGVLISLLTALLVAVAGVSISLRAATAMQAQMTLTWVTLAVFLPAIVIQFLPGTQTELTRFLLTVDMWPLITISLLVLAVTDGTALAFAAAKYQRDNLLSR